MRGVPVRVDLPAPLTAALCAVLAMLPFAVYPAIDPLVSGLFFDGKGWMAGPFSNVLRFVLWRLSAVVLFAALVLWLVALLRKRPALGGSARAWGLIVLTYALGPGVMADGLLKRFWGRARPADVTGFGGQAEFTPPWWPTDQCVSNCSFVSGEVSGATAAAIGLVIALGLWRDRLSPAVYRLLVAAALALPLLSALQRMSSGRHFLSDVIFAALFTLLIASLLRVALFGRNTPAT